MQRCLALAALGAGNVAPNPMVGAVLVYDNRIIGEGYHQQYGGLHAEPNCIASVKPEDEHLISHSTLYVSLEPCSHFGKTPPCSDLIIQKKIPRVVIGCRDSFKKVNGTGIEKLVAAGIDVICGVLENECLVLNRRFFTFHEKQRPYIILKWAQSNNGRISGADYLPLKISNDLTNRLVHKWRSEEAAILIGANTALHDNPSLTTRLWKGRDPVRVLLDDELTINKDAKIFGGVSQTIVINKAKEEEKGLISFRRANKNASSILKVLFDADLTSVIIEGGAKTLQLFIDNDLWDEARVITNTKMHIAKGLNAPLFNEVMHESSQEIFDDKINYYTRH